MPIDPQGQIGALAQLLGTPEGILKVATALAAQGITPAMVEEQAGGLGGGGLGADIAPATLPPGPPVMAPQAQGLPAGPGVPTPTPPAAVPPPPPPPPPAPVPAPQETTGDSLLKALAAVQAPPAPAVPRLPTGTAPLPRGGGTIDPRLLEQIMALLAPAAGTTQAPASSLGALITGRR